TGSAPYGMRVQLYGFFQHLLRLRVIPLSQQNASQGFVSWRVVRILLHQVPYYLDRLLTIAPAFNGQTEVVVSGDLTRLKLDGLFQMLFRWIQILLQIQYRAQGVMENSIRRMLVKQAFQQGARVLVFLSGYVSGG